MNGAQLAEPGTDRAAGALEVSVNRMRIVNDRAESLEHRLTTMRDRHMGGEPPLNREAAGKSPQEVRPTMHELSFQLETLEATQDRISNLVDQLGQL